MITPAYSMTSTERVLPRLALDFTTASLDPRVTVTRALNTATCVGSDGYIRTVNADLPRFDYNPSTLACRGLLIEESRINIRSYSEDFSNAIWAPTGLNQTGTPAWVNVAASPANTLTADKLIADTSTGRHRVVGGAQATASGSRYAMSIFAKKSEYSKIAIGEFNNGVGWASFNLLTGAVIATGGTGSPTASIEAYKDDWFRCILTFAAGAFSRFDVYALNDAYTNTDPSSYNFTGDNTSGVFIWGADLELGAFATSYIPTTTTSVTRNADVVQMTGTNFSSWYNASQGAIYVEGSRFTSLVFSAQVAISDGSTTNEIYICSNTPGYGGTSAIGRISATTGGDTWVGPTAVNTTAKMMLTYGTTNSFAVNGSAGSAIVASQPTVDRMLIGARGNGSNALNGYVRKIMYYPQRLTDRQIQAISK